METYGLISLVPVLVVVVVALVTKRTFESILLGVVVGFLIAARGNPLETFNLFLDSLYTVMMDENTVWILLICGLLGSVVALMEKAGGVNGFSELVEKRVKNRTAAVIMTWILGIVIFFDDYLNCLVIGSSMRKLTDKYRVSRDMLAYIVNSTGVTVCAIVPFSSWSAFMSGLMEGSGMTGGLSAQGAYINTIPFIFYGWLAVVVTPLFALRVLPLFGPMKKTEDRALATGDTMTEDAKREWGVAAEADAEAEPQAAAAGAETADAGAKPKRKNRAINFLLPILVFAFLTVWTEDILYGIFGALGLCFVMYLPQRLMKVGEFFDTLVKGVMDMLPVLLLIILAYQLQEANKMLGLTEFVMENTMNILSPALLPFTIFVVIGLLSLATGTFWGLAAISFPLVAPMAAGLGANPFLCAGALISAVCFGGHICLYSDTVILTSASTQTTAADYFRSSGPLVLATAIVAAIGFLIAGFVMA